MAKKQRLVMATMLAKGFGWTSEARSVSLAQWRREKVPDMPCIRVEAGNSGKGDFWYFYDVEEVAAWAKKKGIDFDKSVVK